MAKQVKTPKVQKDHYARASYLFQAAAFHGKTSNLVMARMMARNVDLVAKRTVTRLSPHVKRQICKACNTVMIPGLTMALCVENRSRERTESADVLVHTCVVCNNVKRFPVGKNPGYELHCDRARLEKD